MKKIVFTCGIIAGLISSAWFVYSMAQPFEEIDFQNGMIYGYATMLLAFSLIFVGIKNYRDKHNGGEIRFGKAFLIGLYITLIASTVYVLVWLIDYNFFIPDFGERYTDYMLEQMRAEGKPETEILEEKVKMEEFSQMYKNPFFNALITYTEILPVGLLLSLIAAAVLNRRPRKPDTVTEGQ